MAWYPAPNNSTVGLTGMFNYLKSSMDTVFAGNGGNMVAISLLLPAWAIIFFPLARFNPTAAFTVASFVTWVMVIWMMALGMVSEMAFIITLMMWIGGAITYYLQTRG